MQSKSKSFSVRSEAMKGFLQLLSVEVFSSSGDREQQMLVGPSREEQMKWEQLLRIPCTLIIKQEQFSKRSTDRY